MTLSITDIELFTLLKAKIGEKEATAVIDFVKQETAITANKTNEVISKDFGSLQVFLNGKFKDIDDRFKDMPTKDFVQKEIIVSKNDTLKWFVGLFITLALMVIGLYFKK